MLASVIETKIAEVTYLQSLGTPRLLCYLTVILELINAHLAFWPYTVISATEAYMFRPKLLSHSTLDIYQLDMCNMVAKNNYLEDFLETNKTTIRSIGIRNVKTTDRAS